MAKATRAEQISDTVEFRDHHLTQPTVTHMDHIVHGVNTLTCALHNTPHIACENQLLTIDALHRAIHQWTKTAGPPQTKPHHTTLSHTGTQPRSILCPMCRPQEYRPPSSPPRVVIPKPTSILIPQISIASRSLSLLYPAKFLQSLAMPVLDETSRQLLQYRQLRKNPKFAHIWNTS